MNIDKNQFLFDSMSYVIDWCDWIIWFVSVYNIQLTESFDSWSVSPDPAFRICLLSDKERRKRCIICKQKPDSLHHHERKYFDIVPFSQWLTCVFIDPHFPHKCRESGHKDSTKDLQCPMVQSDSGSFHVYNRCKVQTKIFSEWHILEQVRI